MGMRVCHVPASPTCDARTTHDAPNPCQIERKGQSVAIEHKGFQEGDCMHVLPLVATSRQIDGTLPCQYNS